MYLSTDGSHLVRHNNHLQAHRAGWDWHADGSTLLADRRLLQADEQDRGGPGQPREPIFPAQSSPAGTRADLHSTQWLVRCLHRLRG